MFTQVTGALSLYGQFIRNVLTHYMVENNLSEMEVDFKTAICLKRTYEMRVEADYDTKVVRITLEDFTKVTKEELHG